MSYKYSTGSVRYGDIYYEDDREGQPTYIDFGIDTITLRPSGSQILHAAADAVGIGTTSPDYTLDVAGDIGVDEYIYHNGDADTLIRFNDDKIVLKAGNKAMVTVEEKASAPHEVTINDGSNNIDFVVKGNGSRGGNPGIKFDASTNKLGINGVGTPEESLHVDGNIKAFGDDVRIKLDGDTDSHPGLELYENGTRKWIIYNNYTNDNLTFKTDSDNIMSITQTGRVGVGTQTPSTTFSVAGSLSLNVTAIDKNNNNSSTYTVAATDYAIFANTRPAAQNGINSALTITLPLAGDYPGRILVVKDGGGYAATNSITIQRAGSDMIDGSQTSIVISNDNDAITLMSNGGTMWFTL